MNTREIREEWIRRLRSGEYDQGRNVLCMDGKYCCLGVLCEMFPDDLQKAECVEDGRTYITFDGCTATLPYAPREKADIRPDLVDKLIHMNDSTGENHKTFPEIADYLEEKWGYKNV